MGSKMLWKEVIRPMFRKEWMIRAVARCSEGCKRRSWARR